VCVTHRTTPLPTDAKVALFQTCLTGYSGTGDIFDVGIADSPRFAWAPQYWHDVSSTGTSWQPVLVYRMVFVGGLWFNCTGGGTPCGATFYPDEETTAPICDAQGSNCQLLNLDQMSAWCCPTRRYPTPCPRRFPVVTSRRSRPLSIADLANPV
jgi:hypothetical protein